VIGSKVYLFVSFVAFWISNHARSGRLSPQGGCLVNTTQVFSTLYTCDLVTYRWERIPLAPDDSSPPARCFHSADSCNSTAVLVH
jgi:hypothetical protein